MQTFASVVFLFINLKIVSPYANPNLPPVTVNVISSLKLTVTKFVLEISIF
jgi:hypothetical protein